jgi:hypothetical protein
MNDNVIVQIIKNYDQKELTGNFAIDLVIQL